MITIVNIEKTASGTNFPNDILEIVFHPPLTNSLCFLVFYLKGSKPELEIPSKLEGIQPDKDAILGSVCAYFFTLFSYFRGLGDKSTSSYYHRMSNSSHDYHDEA